MVPCTKLGSPAMGARLATSLGYDKMAKAKFVGRDGDCPSCALCGAPVNQISVPLTDSDHDDGYGLVVDPVNQPVACRAQLDFVAIGERFQAGGRNMRAIKPLGQLLPELFA